MPHDTRQKNVVCPAMPKKFFHIRDLGVVAEHNHPSNGSGVPFDSF
jgi:hypothetical protein